LGRKHLVVWLGAAAVVLVALVHDELARRKVYTLGVSDFLARDLSDRRVRVHGVLASGTLCRVEESCGYRLTLVDASHEPRETAGTLPINFDGCVIPDALRERPGFDVDVYVVGERCASCHSFNATDILTRSYLDPTSTPVPELPPLCDALTPRM
jgi:hypothetical protein